jgi:transcriptional regulator
VLALTVVLRAEPTGRHAKMYIPHYYRIDDRDQISEYLTRYPFGILVAFDGNKPIAVHIPWEWREHDGHLMLEGHVARNNPLWQAAPNNSEVLVIFQGPHTYISPSWYQEQNVPTWNYIAIHVYGACRIMDETQLEVFLERLVAHYEDGRPNARLWQTLTEDFRRQQIRGIVGLVVDVARIEAAAKMSQNRKDADFRNIADVLGSSEVPQDVEVSKVMKTVRPKLFGDSVERS